MPSKTWWLCNISKNILCLHASWCMHIRAFLSKYGCLHGGSNISMSHVSATSHKPTGFKKKKKEQLSVFVSSDAVKIREGSRADAMGSTDLFTETWVSLPVLLKAQCDMKMPCYFSSPAVHVQTHEFLILQHCRGHGGWKGNSKGDNTPHVDLNDCEGLRTAD